MPAPTLTEAISQYGREAYLLTVGKDGPHTGHVSVHLHGNVIACAIGASAAKNIASEPNISLFWPPQERGGYAMIINGDCRGKARAGGADHGRDHVDEVRLPSPGAEAGRQRRTMRVGL